MLRQTAIARRRQRARLLLVAVATSLCGTAAAFAQQPASPAGPVVRLTSPPTPPGSDTFVTVMLTNVPGTQVQVLKTEIEFQAHHLVYVTSRAGFSADLAGATVDVTVLPAEESAAATPPATSTSATRARPTTRIAITVTGKKPIPNGPLAELRFRLGPAFRDTAEHAARARAGDAPGEPAGATTTPPRTPGASSSPVPKVDDAAAPAAPRVVIIKIAHRSQAVSPEGVNVERLVAEPGEVRVTTERKGRVPMVFACFFYMH
jgi:hypothetical protein